MMPDRHELHRRWLTLLAGERDRRSGVPSGEEALAWLADTLDQMHERLAAAPGFQPLTPSESAATLREIEAVLTKRG